MTERRKRTNANRHGRVYQRASDKRWVAVAYPPPAAGGKPKPCYGRTQAEATRKRDEVLRDWADGLPGAEGKDTLLGKYLDHWLGKTLPQIVEAGHMDHDTMTSYSDMVRLHIRPELGSIPLGALKAPRIRQWLSDMRKKPVTRTQAKPRAGARKKPRPALPPQMLSARTCNYCRTVLHKALADAIRDQEWGIRENPVDVVKPIKAEPSKIRPPSRDESEKLLKVMTSHPLYPLWLTYMALGLRRGEALGLRWADIDFANLTVTPGTQIKRQRTGTDPVTGRNTTALVAKKLKTVASAATIPAPAILIAELEKHRKEQRRVRAAARVWLTGDLVFTTSVGTAMEPRNVNRAWKAVCRDAGVRDDIRIHDLRHHAGTVLNDRGANPKTVQAFLRHSRQSTTGIYVHEVEETMREAANLMDEVIVDLREAGAKRARRDRKSS